MLFGKKIVCFKEGQTDDRWSKQVNSDQQRKKRARGDVRTGCKSRIQLWRNKHVLVGLLVLSQKVIILQYRFLLRCIYYVHTVVFLHQIKHWVNSLQQSMCQFSTKAIVWNRIRRAWECTLHRKRFEKLWRNLRDGHKGIDAETFFAGMSSSQISESSHVFFKRYVSSKNSLMDFIVRFNKALRHQRHNELVADHTEMNGAS